ncbi:unnamed protein product [Peronospora belbahrii]|uniref:SUN domain-containing protein n=1 Tax=Peronospora belbahrii TaxID=622444 RepID=A0AAU9L6J4_9STRA|nr:unnamed protein product [Peronospora belbahrii]
MGIKDRHQKLWLRRNAWLLAIATFVVMIYGVTIVRTTTWAHTFGVKQNEERASNSGQMVRDNNAMKKTMELDALRGEHAQAEAEKPMEETAENGRKQLMKKEGEQETVAGVNIHDAHTAVTTGLRVHLMDKAENMVLPNDDTFSLDDSGHNLVDEAIANTVEGLVNTEKPKKDDKWTVIKTNSVADQTNDGDRRTDDAVKVPSTMDYKGPIPLTTLLTSTGNGSDHLRTGVDKLPGAEQAHNTMLPVSSGSAMMQNTQIQPSVFMSRRFDKSRLALKTSNISIPFEKRHHVLVGYNATMEYLQVYTKPADSQEELFLFFTCSYSKDDWTPNCARARKKVYDTFATSPFYQSSRNDSRRTSRRMDKWEKCFYER